jgi:hypothetical protein
MLTIDEAYERILAFTRKKASRGEFDFTFSELQRSFPDLDPSEIFAKVHLLKDAWVINEVSPNCFTINTVLLDAPSISTSKAGKNRKGLGRKVKAGKSF